MAVAFRAVASTTGTDASAEGAIPTGTLDGDLMIAFVALAASSSTITTPPTGWTLRAADPNPADFSCLCYARVKQSGDTAPTWTVSAAGNWTVDIVSFSGVDTATPVDVSTAEIVAAGSAIALGAITPTVNNTMLVGWACIDATGSARTWTQDGAMTEALDRLDSAMHRSAAYELLSGGSGVGQTRTFTDASGGSAQDIGGFLMALTPAVSSTPVDATRQLRYNVRNDVTASRQLRYDLENAVSATRQLRYDLENAVSATRQAHYNILNVVSAERQLRYNSASVVSTVCALAYNILVSVDTARQLRYDIEAVASATRALAYDIEDAISAERQLRYDIENVGIATRQLRYDITAPPAAIRTLHYSVDSGGTARLRTVLRVGE